MMAKSPQQTLEQERARQAWHDVQEAKQTDFSKKYGSLARKVPMMVLTNGLGQTVAFLLAKAKRHEPEDKQKSEAKAHNLLYTHLSRWVMSQMNSNGDLMEWIQTVDSLAYRRATTEALAYLNWLKRFAEAELPTED